MNTREIMALKDILKQFGANYDRPAIPRFVEWLTSCGCPPGDAEALALILPNETISLSTQSFNIANVYSDNDALACSTGEADCILKLVEVGLLAVGDTFSPDLYLIRIDAPFTGPTYLLEHFMFDDVAILDERDFRALGANLFDVLGNLRRSPDKSLRLLAPRWSPKDRRMFTAELTNVFSSR